VKLFSQTNPVGNEVAAEDEQYLYQLDTSNPEAYSPVPLSESQLIRQEFYLSADADGNALWEAREAEEEPPVQDDAEAVAASDEISAVSAQLELNEKDTADLDSSIEAFHLTKNQQSVREKLRETDFSPRKSAKNPTPHELQLKNAQEKLHALKVKQADDEKSEKEYYKKKFETMDKAEKDTTESEKAVKEQHQKNCKEDLETRDLKASVFQAVKDAEIRNAAAEMEKMDAQKTLDDLKEDLTKCEQNLVETAKLLGDSTSVLEALHITKKKVS
jgi:hypothetical protein